MYGMGMVVYEVGPAVLCHLVQGSNLTLIS